MEVQLTPEQEARLSALAAEQGRETASLVREAISRFLDYDTWFLREVDRGITAAAAGDFVEDDEVRRLIDSRYPA